MATEVAYRGRKAFAKGRGREAFGPANESFFCSHFEFFYLVFSFSLKQNPKNK
jgi:hypothetical protein